MIATRSPECASASVVGLAHEYAAGSEVVHAHEDFGQILYAVRGAMTVHAAHGCWVLPPQRALWIPAGVPHTFSHLRPISLRTVYVRRGTLGAPAWAHCTVMHVSALVRELILACVAQPWDHEVDSRAYRVGRVLLDQLSLLRQEAFFLPEPVDPRAVKAARVARSDPTGLLGSKDIAREAGASDRTLDRLFTAEVGMGFGAWRRNLRLITALERLASGQPVSVVASSIGYENASSFVAVFKSAFGVTPARYFLVEKS